MADWHYKVVALPRHVEVSGRLKGKASPGEVMAERAEREMAAWAEEGWEFYRMDRVLVSHRPGCLGMLLGGRAKDLPYNLLTFRRAGAEAKAEEESVGEEEPQLIAER
jgi:hypothetical protein